MSRKHDIREDTPYNKDNVYKKEKSSGLVQLIIELIVLAIILLFIATAFLGVKGIRVPYVSDILTQIMRMSDRTTERTDETASQQMMEEDMTVVADPVDGNTQAPEEEQPEEEPELHDYNQYILLGDSRFVGMHDVMAGERDHYICEVGMGYYWMLDQLEEVRALANADSDTALIIELGVNDLENIDLYLEKANELAEELDCRIFYMTVNPVDEEKENNTGYDITNEEIEAFNRALKDGLDASIIMIDTYSFLNNNDFDTVDGIHYTDETYSMIYDYVKDYVQAR